MEFSCVLGVGFSIDFVSKNRSDFHGFSQTAWKNVLVSKPCQSVESSMMSRQNRFPQFSRNTKNPEKTRKRLAGNNKLDSRNHDPKATILENGQYASDNSRDSDKMFPMMI